MKPPIGPLGLEYIGGVARQSGIETDVLDLCFEQNPDEALKKYFASKSPRLVGLSFRNVDDCFWPSAEWFVPELAETVKAIKKMTDAAVVIGGIGFSIYPKQIVEYTGADFGVKGDGEEAVVQLYRQLEGSRNFADVDGLIWRQDGNIYANKPAWPQKLSLPAARDIFDNRAYFAQGGQAGIETKRGCFRSCIYCADPIAKGPRSRGRNPSEVADEVQSLLKMGINVLHICDCEFNIPREHAYAVCEEFVRRKLGEKVRWYTYMSITPFDSELAAVMKKAGCAGIDFTTDAANDAMLGCYHQPYLKEDIATAVRICRENGITVMLDLLLGGPGESAQTVAETISFVKRINPDCAGAPLGVRIYSGTAMEKIVEAEGPAEKNPNIKRKYDGPIDYFQPTFYISSLLGERPAQFVRDLIGDDKRFFPPTVEITQTSAGESGDHNYNDNTILVEAIRNGARGAYWDILRKIKEKK